MFSTLVESTATHTSRRGAMTLSIIAHSAIIAAATVATAAGAPGPKAAPVVITPIALPPSPRPDVPRRSRTSPTEAAAHRVAAMPPIVNIDPVLPAPPRLPIGNDVASPDFPAEPISSIGATVGAARSVDSGSVFDEARVERVAALLTRVTPTYPEILRRAGVGGRVLVRFVVDTTGRVEPSSIEVITSSSEAFTRSVRDVLPSLRFAPAEANGRRVRMLVEMPFEFAIDDR